MSISELTSAVLPTPLELLAGVVFYVLVRVVLRIASFVIRTVKWFWKITHLSRQKKEAEASRSRTATGVTAVDSVAHQSHSLLHGLLD